MTSNDDESFELMGNEELVNTTYDNATLHEMSKGELVELVEELGRRFQEALEELDAIL